MTLRKIARKRRETIADILLFVEPHLWESGWVTGDIGASVPLRIWMPEGRRAGGAREVKMGGYVLTGMFGLTAEGVITDCAMCPYITPYEDFPLEDLLKLRAWAGRRFGDVPVSEAA